MQSNLNSPSSIHQPYPNGLQMRQPPPAQTARPTTGIPLQSRWVAQGNSYSLTAAARKGGCLKTPSVSGATSPTQRFFLVLITKAGTPVLARFSGRDDQNGNAWCTSHCVPSTSRSPSLRENKSGGWQPQFANSLRNPAHDLVEAVSVFRLSAGGQGWQRWHAPSQGPDQVLRHRPSA